MRQTTPSTEARDLRQLLAVVLDALTVPNDADDYDQRIDARARIARVTVGEALAESPDQLGWNADFLRQRLATEQAEADERAKIRCGRCHQPFDSTDTRFDGRARYGETPYCRSCVDNCHEGSAEHVCRICDPQRYGGTQ
ncbi:hypothetical protein PV733_07225 [Streptomyces europaeiscabiei]|uniref:hypothetical protein n=1 Tax=Streptomyces europaeiscabiei TaxID=146819 RepID=UPI0029ABF705|nr:hypothetical protein [Streptomyces europaeiscabiei]MDX3708765.1 hypothetical protein [Streptomyces europaeiscabiei]